MVLRDEEKIKVFNAFFASAFSSKSCSLVSQPPELVNKDREENEALIIQEEMFSELLKHLDVHRSIEMGSTQG